jgi:hypothetical protein
MSMERLVRGDVERRSRKGVIIARVREFPSCSPKTRKKGSRQVREPFVYDL